MNENTSVLTVSYTLLFKVSHIHLKQAKKVKTIAVGIGHMVSKSELNTIAMGIEENVICVNDFTFLASALSSYKDAFCAQILGEKGLYTLRNDNLL